MLNISVDSGQRARRVIDDGIPEVSAAVDTGKVTVCAAADVVKQPRNQNIKQDGGPYRLGALKHRILGRRVLGAAKPGLDFRCILQYRPKHDYEFNQQRDARSELAEHK